MIFEVGTSKDQVPRFGAFSDGKGDEAGKRIGESQKTFEVLLPHGSVHVDASDDDGNRRDRAAGSHRHNGEVEGVCYPSFSVAVEAAQQTADLPDATR